MIEYNHKTVVTQVKRLLHVFDVDAVRMVTPIVLVFKQYYKVQINEIETPEKFNVVALF